MASKRHEKLIRAWLDGAIIQQVCGSRIVDIDGDPEFNEYCEYRIKPAEPEREYPKTEMTGQQLYQVAINTKGSDWQSMVAMANAALRHACDNGQVVTRAEFDRAIGDRAARDMAVAKAVTVRCYWNVGDSLEAHKLHDRMTEEVLKDVISQVK